MDPYLCILCLETPTSVDLSLAQLARFLGLRVEFVRVHRAATEPADGPAMTTPGGLILALGTAALRQCADRDWFQALLEQSAYVFAYGFAAEGEDGIALQWLTNGAFSSVTSMEAGRTRFTVHAGVRFGGFPVSGKSWSEESANLQVFAGETGGSGVATYISADGRPLLVTAERGTATVFLLADVAWADLDTTLAAGASLRPWYVSLIAASIFLRSAFGSWCWTSPVTAATVIIDDPYLRKRYGFVYYEALMRELSDSRSALTIAFIPYNYRRSDPATVSLVRGHSERFSIAVHGCDHTAGEFASNDQQWLIGTARCALDRMEAHERTTGIQFDNVMVIPQGRFSTKSISALRLCGFDAVVNTTPWPFEPRDARLSVRDLLDAAVTRFDSLPIFVRRYPRDIFDHAFDALFQKPLLVVEHHTFFRGGYAQFAEYVRQLSGLGSKTEWMTLGRTVISSCLLRQTGHAHYALRHFTAKLHLRNPTSGDISLSLEKPEEEGVVDAVFVGDESVPFESDGGWLRYAAHLRVGEDLKVSVRYRVAQAGGRTVALSYRFKASARRMLSEARDNYLARNLRVLSIAEKLKGSFGGASKRLKG